MSAASLPAQASMLVAGASKTSSSGSSSATFIIFLVVIGLVGYFFLLRPQQQKARRQRAALSDIGVGDEIVTIGGIVGTVLEMDGDRVTIVTGVDPEALGAPDAGPTRLVLLRSAVSRKANPVVVPGQDVAAEPGTEHPGYGGVPSAGHDDQDSEAGTNGAHDRLDDQDRTDGGSKEGGEP